MALILLELIQFLFSVHTVYNSGLVLRLCCQKLKRVSKLKSQKKEDLSCVLNVSFEKSVSELSVPIPIQWM